MSLPGLNDAKKGDASSTMDNISDEYLKLFRSVYGNPAISKDDIWEYIYGVMHAPDWRKKYDTDLRKSLPRIPMASDFEAFRRAGRELMDLHVGYETCPELESIVITIDDKPVGPDGNLPDPDSSNLDTLDLVASGDATSRDVAPEDSPSDKIWRIEKNMSWGGVLVAQNQLLKSTAVAL